MEMTLQGVRVHYEIGGHGERKVVLLHGWGCSEKLMAGISDALTPDMTVLRVDFPAHGESGFPPQPWGVPDFAANLLELLTKLDFLPCSVIAHSFGGRVAIELAADHPECFEKLILTGAAGIRPKDPVIINNLGNTLFKARRYEEAVVYYCVDEFGAFTGYDRAAIGAVRATPRARAQPAW